MKSIKLINKQLIIIHLIVDLPHYMLLIHLLLLKFSSTPWPLTNPESSHQFITFKDNPWLLFMGKLLTCDVLQNRFSDIISKPYFTALLFLPYLVKQCLMSWVYNVFMMNQQGFITKRDQVLLGLIVSALCCSIWLGRDNIFLNLAREYGIELGLELLHWFLNHTDFLTFLLRHQ